MTLVLDEIERWAAEARARDAVEDRIRQRDLRRAASGDAGFTECLLDLAEQAGTVVISTIRATSHAGRIVIVGSDFVGLRTMGDRLVLIRFKTIADVSPAPTARVTATGERAPSRIEVGLSDVLESAANAGSRLSLRCGDRVLNGDLRSVGRDVIIVWAPGPPPRPSYVMLTSVSEVSFFGSG